MYSSNKKGKDLHIMEIVKKLGNMVEYDKMDVNIVMATSKTIRQREECQNTEN